MYKFIGIKPVVYIGCRLKSKLIIVDYEADTDLIIYGDDGGYVNVLYLRRKFIVDTAGDNEVTEITASKLLRKDSLEKNKYYYHLISALV
jgi:hypothetical protein